MKTKLTFLFQYAWPHDCWVELECLPQVGWDIKVKGHIVGTVSHCMIDMEEQCAYVSMRYAPWMGKDPDIAEYEKEDCEEVVKMLVDHGWKPQSSHRPISFN